MDHPLPSPIGLAALITATVTLFSAGTMDQAGQAGKQNAMISQQPTTRIALSGHAFSPSVVTALQNDAVRRTEEPISSRSSQRTLVCSEGSKLVAPKVNKDRSVPRAALKVISHCNKMKLLTAEMKGVM